MARTLVLCTIQASAPDFASRCCMRPSVSTKAALPCLASRPPQKLHRPLHGRAPVIAAARPAGPLQVQVQIIRAKADATYKPPFTSMPDCIRQSFAANGFRAPFQGLGPTLLRNIPANSIYLGSFEVMKIEAAKAYNCSVPELPAWVVLSSAGAPPNHLLTLVLAFPAHSLATPAASQRRQQPRTWARRPPRRCQHRKACIVLQGIVSMADHARPALALCPWHLSNGTASRLWLWPTMYGPPRRSYYGRPCGGSRQGPAA